MADGKPSGDQLVTALCCGVAMALAAVASSKGPGLTPDSVGYLTAGINAAGSDGLVMLADQPLTIFPPGLPLIAALGEVIGPGAETTLRVVSVASFGAIVALGSRLLRRVVTHRTVVLGSMVLLAVSPVLLSVSKMAWSEPPFIVVTLLFLEALGRVWQRRALTTADVLTLSALCSIAFLLRYIGLSLIAVAGIALLAVVRPLDGRALRRIAGFGALSIVVPVACALRNHAADGTFLGNRLVSHDSLWDIGVRIAATLGGWVVPGSGASTRQLALIGVTGTVLTALVLVMANRPDGLTDAGARARLACCGLFIVVFVAYLTGAALNTAFEPINSRYLTPVYVPAVVVAAVGVQGILQRVSHGLWRVSIGALVVIFLAAQLLTSIRDTRDGAADGIAYNGKVWTDSDVAAAAVRIVDGAAEPVVYSNNPNALWAATRMQPLHFAPRDVAFRGVPAVGELNAFVERVACTSATSYLVFYLFGDDRVISLAEIRDRVDTTQVATADDGAIFRVTAEHQGTCPQHRPRPTRVR